MNQREQQKKATIRRILTAAQTLFMNHGYAAVTTRMIADAAGVQQPLLYHYYKTKEALYLAVVMDVSETMAAKIIREQADEQHFVAKVRRLGHVLTDDHTMNLQLVLHDIGNLDDAVRQSVFQAWQTGLLAPLDRFFGAFKKQLAPTYQIREITLYFLTVLAAYLQPAQPDHAGTGFQRQLSMDRALAMFCTGVMQGDGAAHQ